MTESEQLRREPPDIAPRAELEHWRRILAKFSSIVEHFKSPECRTFIQLLVQAYSKLMKVFFLCISLINIISYCHLSFK